MSVVSRSLFATRFARVAAWLVLLLPGTLQAGVAINPLAWGLNPGDTFRLVVVTAGGTTGVSTSASYYDTFVNSQGLSSITYDGASLPLQARRRTRSGSTTSTAGWSRTPPSATENSGRLRGTTNTSPPSIGPSTGAATWPR